MSCRTCCFSGYLGCINLVLLLLSLGMMGLMLYIICTGNGGSVIGAIFSDLASIATAKWGTLGAAALLMIASIIGMTFSCTKGRVSGSIYLIMVVAALGLQIFVVVTGAGGSLSMINHISKELISKKTPPVETNGKKKNTMRKTFENFRGQFDHGKKNQECSFKEKEKTKEEKSPDKELAFVALAEEKMPWLRRGAASAPLRKLKISDAEAETSCVPKKMEVTCAKDGAFGKSLTKFCKSNGHDESFTKTCKGCRKTYWSHWDLDSTFSEDQKDDKKKLHDAFEADAGKAYCRCLSGFISFVEGHYPYIAGVGCTFVVLEVLLICATIYLMICGQPEEDGNFAKFMDPDEGLELTATQTMVAFETVECPRGCKPGDTIMVTTQSGQNVGVTVPDGVFPGMMFNVEIPL